MRESDSIDARWQRERRRVGFRAGLGFGVLGVAFGVIERSGVLAPIVGSDVAAGGPFTLRWIAALLGGALIGGVLAGYGIGWTVPPPSERTPSA